MAWQGGRGGGGPGGTVAIGLVRALERVVPGAQRRTRQLARAGAVGECLALGAEVARRPERLPGRRRARPAAALPIGRAGSTDRGIEAGRATRAEDEVKVQIAAVVGRGKLRAFHELGWDLEQEARRDTGLAHPHVARRQACDRNRRRFARVIPT